MRLIIDQDEVLAEWLDKVIEIHNKRCGTTYKKSDVDSWDVSKALGPEYAKTVDLCYSDPDFYSSLLPVPGALEGMRELNRLGHDLIIATATPAKAKNAVAAKAFWIEQYLPWFEYRNFVSISRKNLIQADMILDDGAHNIVACNLVGMQTVVFDAPWNKSCLSTYRVKSWPEFVSLVKHIDDKK